MGMGTQESPLWALSPSPTKLYMKEEEIGQTDKQCPFHLCCAIHFFSVWALHVLLTETLITKESLHCKLLVSHEGKLFHPSLLRQPYPATFPLDSQFPETSSFIEVFWVKLEPKKYGQDRIPRPPLLFCCGRKKEINFLEIIHSFLAVFPASFQSRH